MIIYQNLFKIHHNKHYLQRYIKFISSRQKPVTGYTEKHHILPRSLFPEYKTLSDNIIELTAREHFIAHLILWKAFGDKMAYAFNSMMRQSTQQQRYTKINSILYQSLKIEMSELKRKQMLDSNPMSVPEYVEKVRQSKIGQNNPNFGKQGTMYGKQHSPEAIAKLRISAANRSKRKCEFCGKETSPNNYAQFHGNNCKHNPLIDPDIVMLRLSKSNNASRAAAKKIVCEVCNATISTGMYKRWHGINCRHAPNMGATALENCN